MTAAWSLAEAADWCRRTCLDLPDVTLDHPFGPDSDVLRIHRRMFALIMHVPHVSEHMLVNLKADPDEVPLLVETHDVVLPGYHMNKRHWVSVELRPGVDVELVEGLIEDSYDWVVAGLPARLRSPLTSLGPGPRADQAASPRPSRSARNR